MSLTPHTKQGETGKSAEGCAAHSADSKVGSRSGVKEFQEIVDSVEGAHKPLSPATIASLSPAVRHWLDLPGKVIVQIRAEKLQRQSTTATDERPLQADQ